ncbi:MAG: hypothetical protein ACLFVW_02620 [Phycisphaerae bacterium]
MRNKASIAVFLCLATTVVWLTGCSEGESRKAGRQLREAVDQAVQLHEAALSLAGNPYLEDPAADKRVTYLENPTAEQLERYRAVSRREVNPEALKLLDRAEQQLRDAIRKFADADEADKGVARAVLGRVAVLRGQCNAALAENRRLEAYESLAKLGSAATVLQMKTNLADFYEELLERSYDYIDEMIQKARADTEQLTEELSELDSRLEQWKQQRQELISDNEQLYAKERNLRIDSRQASGTEATELLEKALSVGLERHRNESKIGELEYRMEQARADRKRLELQIDTAKSRLEAAEEMRDAHRRGMAADDGGELSEKVSELRAEIDEYRSRQDETLQDVAQTIDRLVSIETDAAADFELAGDSFGKAAQSAGREVSAAYIALQADALSDMADMHARRLRLRERMDAVLTGGTPGSDETRIVSEYLSNTEEVTQTVVSDYEQAVQLYSRATGQAQPDSRWVYNGEVAAAAIQLYRFSKNDEHRGMAEDALEDLEDVIDSPHLRPLVELREKLAASG